MKDILKTFLIEPVVSIIFMLILIFTFPATALYRLFLGRYPTLNIKKGDLKGRRKLDLLTVLIISVCFWLFLWFISSNFRNSILEL